MKSYNDACLFFSKIGAQGFGTHTGFGKIPIMAILKINMRSHLTAKYGRGNFTETVNWKRKLQYWMTTRYVSLILPSDDNLNWRKRPYCWTVQLAHRRSDFTSTQPNFLGAESKLYNMSERVWGPLVLSVFSWAYSVGILSCRQQTINTWALQMCIYKGLTWVYTRPYCRLFFFSLKSYSFFVKSGTTRILSRNRNQQFSSHLEL